VGPSSTTEHGFAFDRRRVVDKDRRSGFNHGRVRIDLRDAVAHPRDVIQIGGVDLVDDHHISHAQIRFARMIAQFVAGAMRIGHDDVEIALVEGESLLPPSHTTMSASCSAWRRIAA